MIQTGRKLFNLNPLESKFEMSEQEIPTFLFVVDANRIGEHFIEDPESKSKYHTYVSKDFYGAVIRTLKPLWILDGNQVAMSIRLKGSGNRKDTRAAQSVSGIKIDFIELSDPRMEKYGLDPEFLMEVVMKVDANIPGNIVINPQPSFVSAYFYRDGEGSSFINFVPE